MAWTVFPNRHRIDRALFQDLRDNLQRVKENISWATYLHDDVYQPSQWDSKWLLQLKEPPVGYPFSFNQGYINYLRTKIEFLLQGHLLLWSDDALSLHSTKGGFSCLFFWNGTTFYSKTHGTILNELFGRSDWTAAPARADTILHELYAVIKYMQDYGYVIRNYDTPTYDNPIYEPSNGWYYPGEMYRDSSTHATGPEAKWAARGHAQAALSGGGSIGDIINQWHGALVEAYFAYNSVPDNWGGSGQGIYNSDPGLEYPLVSGDTGDDIEPEAFDSGSSWKVYFSSVSGGSRMWLTEPLKVNGNSYGAVRSDQAPVETILDVPYADRVLNSGTGKATLTLRYDDWSTGVSLPPTSGEVINSWSLSQTATQGEVWSYDGLHWACKQSHTTASDKEPGTAGGDAYWEQTVNITWQAGQWFYWLLPRPTFLLIKPIYS